MLLTSLVIGRDAC